MNLPENTLLAAAALALCLDAAAANARPGDVALITGIERVNRSLCPEQCLVEIKVKTKKSDAPGGGFIAPSEAAKRAQHAFGGKILAVRLRGAFYIVKLRGKGHVRKVRVNAITGRVVGP